MNRSKREKMQKNIPVLLFSIFYCLICFLNLAVQANEDIFPEIPPSVLPIAKIDYNDGQDPMNSRLFRTTTTRTQVNLSGFWDFITDPDSIGETESFYTSFPQPETQLWVPGTWNSIPRYWQYQNTAWYNHTFDLPADGNLRIRFDGVFYTSKVWLDGKLIGENEGAYSPFSFLTQNIEKGKHRLTVKVNNCLYDDSLPKKGTDWFPFGGIYRPIYAELVNDIFIDRFHVLATDITENQAKLAIRVYVNNLTGKSVNKKFRFYVNGNLIYTGSHAVTGIEAVIEFAAILQQPELWSPDDPNLYSARVVLGAEEDDQFDRFGVRSLTKEGYKIMLNGTRFKMMGANHHDDHPDWGSALPPNIIRQDIEIIKRMGANAVRGHYPPSEMFMDFCDSYGLMFMNEVPSWQYRPEQLANPVVKEKIKKQYYDMVYRDMNHPAIFSWSLGNEWREFQKAYNDIKELVDYARGVDQTHFLTFITGGAHFDRSAELIDIICTNWAQYQWYWDPSFRDEDSNGEFVSTVLSKNIGDESIRQLNLINETLPDKPVILTEFGGSGSMAGWHNWGNVKWSEEYQARNVWDSGFFGLDQEWLSGGCVWQFCDTRTTHSRMLGPRLRGWNVKGVVDSYRLPKMAFYKLQELFHWYKEQNIAGGN